jgi:farnesyl-diphosphate farnesyltransferase
MGRGMGEYERNRSRSGLRDFEDTQRYCYFVAGVVGEMLTAIFCNYSGEIAAKREFLEDRAVDFGQGLQLTNILKDIWDDIERDTCWLPRELFDNHGYDLSCLEVNHNGGGANFASAMHEMVGITHAKLRRALAYTLEIPRHETGIRRFLIWAVLLAVMTLRNIHANPLFNSKDEVKVSRRTLRTILAVSNAMIRSNVGLRSLFVRAARGLPCADNSRSSDGKTPRRPVVI